MDKGVKKAEGDMTAAEIAAAIAEQILPQFGPQLGALQVLGRRAFDQQCRPCEVTQECEHCSEDDVSYGVGQILGQLAAKGRIYVTEPGPEQKESSAVARCGDLSLIFRTHYNIRELRDELNVACWYYPAS